MPVAAVAKVERATYHSHTAVAALRDDCNTVCLKVPGFALGRSTGDPAYRFEGSSPERTIDWRTQRRAGCRDLKDCQACDVNCAMKIVRKCWLVGRR